MPRPRGLFDDSLVVITSEHGEAFDERAAIEHGLVSVYQHQVHVPLIVKWPPSRPAATDTPSADLLDRLRSLGCIK